MIVTFAIFDSAAPSTCEAYDSQDSWTTPSLVIVSLVAWRRVAPVVSLIDRQLTSFRIQALLAKVQFEQYNTKERTRTRGLAEHSLKLKRRSQISNLGSAVACIFPAHFLISVLVFIPFIPRQKNEAFATNGAACGLVRILPATVKDPTLFFSTYDPDQLPRFL